MKIYKTVISYAGSLDSEIDNIYWDKEAAIRDAKDIIANDEKGCKDPDDYDIDWVYIHTEVSDSNGRFTTIKTEKITH